MISPQKNNERHREFAENSLGEVMHVSIVAIRTTIAKIKGEITAVIPVSEVQPTVIHIFQCEGLRKGLVHPPAVDIIY